mgnify:CR=1 FL=1
MGAGMGTASARPAHMSTAYDERVHSAASAQTRRARPSWPVALAVLLALVAGLLGAGAAPASADGTSADLTITGLDPATVRVPSEVTLSGTLTNTGPNRLAGATVRLWSARGPITNGDALSNALSAEQDVTSTPPVPGAEASATVADLDAGASAPYSLRASSEALGLMSASSAYLVGAMLVDAEGGLIASARTVITCPGEGGYQAATVAVLSSAPSLVPSTDDGAAGQAVLTDDHLAAEIAGGGRLDLIADLAEADDVSSLIDPLLWDELTAMSSGYQVRTGPGTTADGTGQAAAASFLDRLRRIAANGRSHRTLYGSPDVTAAAAAGRGELVGAAEDALPAAHPLAVLPLAVVTDGSSTSQAIVDLLDGVDPGLVLAPDLDADGEYYRVDDLAMLATHESIRAAPGTARTPTPSAPPACGPSSSSTRCRAPRRSTSSPRRTPPEPNWPAPTGAPASPSTSSPPRSSRSRPAPRTRRRAARPTAPGPSARPAATSASTRSSPAGARASTRTP